VWYSAEASRFLGNQYDPAEWDQVTDIIEVWFDSGSTHAFVLEQRPELKWPASLYLEGSDQHRGWFNSSLLEACGTRGRAPVEAVPPAEMPELERWVLHRLAELDRLVRQSIADYDFHDLFTALHNFCAVDLSAFYFDIRKDRLYCDAADDLRRRATRTVLDR